ncbi:MAG: 2-oxoglutarate dehydrogenase E1 component, partial [Pseudomonadota bacterium]|nr:2-oxoglutarate dehydrogenase E1 component [Pseudomonadota bacterium]
MNSLESLFIGANGVYIAELYERFLDDPGSVDASWSKFFDKLGDDAASVRSEIAGASWARSRTSVIGNDNAVEATADMALEASGPATDAGFTKAAQASVRARILIRSYRVRGHLNAAFDPLGLIGAGYHKDLDYKTYGFTDDDLDKEIYLDTYTAMAGRDRATLREILAIMRETYCSSIGVEYMHIQDVEERAWIQEQMEGVDFRSGFSTDLKKRIYKDMVEAEFFENYLQ